MKKQTIDRSAISVKDQLTQPGKNIRDKKKDRYIYTEADLGEGILYAGIITAYASGQQKDQFLYNYNGPRTFLYL